MDTTIIGNPDKWPGAFGGTPDQCRDWLEKDEAIRRAAAGTPSAKRAATAPRSDSRLASDLPMSAASLRRTLAAMSPEQAEVLVQKVLVESNNVGGLPVDEIVEAQKRYYGDQLEMYMSLYVESQEEIRTLKLAQNRAERGEIDAIADSLLEFTKEFVVSECKRRVESLQAKVLAKSAQIRNEGDAIEQLNAKATLLDGRVRHLELLSPVCVAVNTRS
jgi:hypothetical protein